jgi:hypothetical protein
MIAELGSSQPSMQKQVREHKAKLREFIKTLVSEIDRTSLPVATLADIIYLLFEGAIVESKIYRDAWPVRTAKKATKELLS